ncbi:LysR family transcriptional regulator [Afifella sp. IM 167]|uniref:LysR family transcriptional regulator n=1 Tax=Afifella sp. IM 167 TaxID=2033586 RepID=UPI001CCE9AA4|nr:LysR family transcriptional regulator [Afifella sp. IM 167]MBZ8131925.1 LysR family transcriptional regulator [Afifella sp. IM 167]
MIGLPALDLDCLRAFVLAADTKSFTAAGNALGATQSTVSVRIRKLEERLGRRLMERTPRSVALTQAGAEFLEDARRILVLNDEAVLRMRGGAPRSFDLGVSDHAAGALLPQLLAGMRQRLPEIAPSVTVGRSAGLFRDFAAGRFEAVIGRPDAEEESDVFLLADRLVWTSSAGLVPARGESLPLVALSAPCDIREIAIGALSATGIAWRTAFVGTGVAAVQAAVSAGLGVACLEARNVPQGCEILGPEVGLPALPATRVVLRMRDGRMLDGPPESGALREALLEAFGQMCPAARPSR